jgi:hypothetical protein
MDDTGNDRAVTVTVQDNGPYRIKGPITIVTPAGVPFTFEGIRSGYVAVAIPRTSRSAMVRTSARDSLACPNRNRETRRRGDPRRGDPETWYRRLHIGPGSVFSPTHSTQMTTLIGTLNTPGT